MPQARRKRKKRVGSLKHSSGRAEKRVLKQVKDDEVSQEQMSGNRPHTFQRLDLVPLQPQLHQEHLGML